MNDSHTNELLAAIRTRLELEYGLGVAFLPGAISKNLSAVLSGCQTKAPDRQYVSPSRPQERVPSPSPAPPAVPSPVRETTQPREAKMEERRRHVTATLVPAGGAPDNDAKERALAPLREQAMACRDCGLCQSRNSVVWGEGSLDAKVMFIGEGPGRDEDLQGRPFVGRSGRLLTDIIEKGMKVPRSSVYITNVVKCRPPGNREPLPDETAACSKYLEAQLAVVKPQVVVAVGGVAGCALLRLPPRSPGLRGRWHQYEDTPLRVIFHPSYLLRRRGPRGERTDADMEVWKDIQQVMGRVDQDQGGLE